LKLKEEHFKLNRWRCIIWGIDSSDVWLEIACFSSIFMDDRTDGRLWRV